MARTADSRTLRVLVVAATLAALAGCGGGGGGPAARPTAGADHGKLIEAVKCMRANGFPDFPDPIEDNGIWVIPEPAANLTPPPTCMALFQGAKGNAPPRRERTAEEIAQRRRWAACIRTNGIPTLPDPDSKGDFQVPAELAPITAQPRWEEAREACKAFETSDMHFEK